MGQLQLHLLHCFLSYQNTISGLLLSSLLIPVTSIRTNAPALLIQFAIFFISNVSYLYRDNVMLNKRDYDMDHVDIHLSYPKQIGGVVVPYGLSPNLYRMACFIV